MSSRSLFDPYDFDSYYFGNITREESESILMSCGVGTFILRNSISQPHGYSLSVRDSLEGPRQVHHYLIESHEGKNGVKKLKMYDKIYNDISNLISYFKMTKLEQTNLRVPAPKTPLKLVIAEHRFDGQNISDLSFARNEILEILRIPDEGWWVARNALGMIGFIPSNYVREKEESDDEEDEEEAEEETDKKDDLASKRQNLNDRPFTSLPFPAIVKVISNRTPNVYDTSSMTLKVGQLIHLTQIFPIGLCFGTNQETGISGTFPVTCVKWTNQPIINKSLPDILPATQKIPPN